MPDTSLAVIGAGIAGLACAAACALRGSDVTVFERASQLSDVGAGIQLGPNAVKVLHQIGADSALAAASRPPDVTFHDALTGKALLTIPLGETISARHGADFLTLHRADLVAALVGRCADLGVKIQTGVPVTCSADGQLSTDAAPVEATAIAVADGINSQIAATCFGAQQKRFTGRIAWRALVPAQPQDAQGTKVWLGPGSHLVIYPIRGGTLTNIVAVTDRQPHRPQDYTGTADPQDIRAAFARYPQEARGFLERIGTARAWGLYSRPSLQTWHNGKLTLLGDAAHPMMPFLAQGAAMALEDAFTYARALHSGVPGAFETLYGQPRRQRTARVARASGRQALIYHARGPLRLARNAALKTMALRAPDARLAPFDWLYGGDVTG